MGRSEIRYPRFSRKLLRRVVEANSRGGVGPSPNYSYSACVAEVECDPETGIYQVHKLWLAHDVGRSINPVQVMGQVEEAHTWDLER